MQGQRQRNRKVQRDGDRDRNRGQGLPHTYISTLENSNALSSSSILRHHQYNSTVSSAVAPIGLPDLILGYGQHILVVFGMDLYCVLPVFVKYKSPFWLHISWIFPLIYFHYPVTEWIECWSASSEVQCGQKKYSKILLLFL